MVPDEDVNIEPVDYVWPLKTAVELCSPKKVGGKFEVVGGAATPTTQGGPFGLSTWKPRSSSADLQ